MPATEILVLSLKSGVDLNDQNGSATSVVNSNFEELRAVDGVQQVKLGVPVEDPTKLQAVCRVHVIAPDGCHPRKGRDALKRCGIGTLRCLASEASSCTLRAGERVQPIQESRPSVYASLERLLILLVCFR